MLLSYKLLTRQSGCLHKLNACILGHMITVRQADPRVNVNIRINVNILEYFYVQYTSLYFFEDNVMCMRISYTCELYV